MGILFGSYGIIHFVLMITLVIGFIYYYRNRVLILGGILDEKIKLGRFRTKAICSLLIGIILYVSVCFIGNNLNALLHYRTLFYLLILVALFSKNRVVANFSYFINFLLVFEVFVPGSSISSDLVLITVLVLNILSIVICYYIMYLHRIDIKKEDFVLILVVFINIFMFAYIVSAFSIYNLMAIQTPKGHLEILRDVYNYDRVMYTLVYLLGYLVLIFVPLYFYHKLTERRFVTEYTTGSVYY